MKIVHSSLFRAIIAIVAGVLMIIYKEEMLRWLTICIGILFFVSGVISCLVYYTQMQNAKKAAMAAPDDQSLVLLSPAPTSLIVGVGSIILGGILVFLPDQMRDALVYVFAAILILGSLNQMLNLIQTSKMVMVGWGFWIMPVVTLLVGILAVVYPSAIATAPLLVIGLSLTIYGISETINAIKIHQTHKYFASLMPPTTI